MRVRVLLLALAAAAPGCGEEEALDAAGVRERLAALEGISALKERPAGEAERAFTGTLRGAGDEIAFAVVLGEPESVQRAAPALGFSARTDCVIGRGAGVCTDAGRDPAADALQARVRLAVALERAAYGR